MARFTFAQAKEKIKELEAKIEDLEGFIAEEITSAEEDIREDFKKVGYGDILFGVIGFALGALLVWIF